MLTFIEDGTTFNAQIDITDDSGNAQNLTAYSVAGQIRKTYDSTTFTAFSASVSNATGGTITISLSATQTNSLAAGRYVYDVEITSGGGVVTRVLEGHVEVTPGATRA